MNSQALIPSLLGKSVSEDQVTRILSNGVAVLSGVLLISALAQIALPLPFTPVPLTGQTLGVLLVGLAFGSRRALAVTTLYLAVGWLGAPVFALGAAGLVWGPTLGYLIGMILSSWAVGTLADRGWTKTFGTALAACLVSSVIIFACGLTVLSQFVPKDQLLMAGLWPFIPGDLIKMSLAISLVRPLHRFID